MKNIKEQHFPGGNFDYGSRVRGDSDFSSYASNKKFPLDYFEEEEVEEKDEEKDETTLFENSLKNHTLDYLFEAKEDDDDDKNDETVEEISTVGSVQGATTKLGTNAEGEVPSKSEQEKRIKDADIYSETVRYRQNWSNKTAGRIKYN